MSIKVNSTCIVSQNYRSLGSIKAPGQFDLEKDEEVEIIAVPSIGPIPVKKVDGTTINVNRAYSFILKEKEEPVTTQNLKMEEQQVKDNTI